MFEQGLFGLGHLAWIAPAQAHAAVGNAVQQAQQPGRAGQARIGLHGEQAGLSPLGGHGRPRERGAIDVGHQGHAAPRLLLVSPAHGGQRRQDETERLQTSFLGNVGDQVKLILAEVGR